MPSAAGLLAIVLLQRPDTASPGSRPPGHAAAPAIRAAPLPGPVRIDGRLDDPAWAAATPAMEFTQRDPHEGQPASERTEVRVLISDDALYVGARMFDSDPRGIRAALARRDQAVESDLFEVFIDSYHDHLSAVRFRINPAGAIRDAVLGASAQGSGDDPSWDPVWESAARIDSLGWAAELRIPLSQLRYNTAEDGAWGIQFGRSVLRKGEVSFFAFTPKREQAGVNRYGHLVGLGRLRPQRQVEVLPYTSARAELRRVAAGNPFRDGSDLFGSAGLDVKYGVTSDLTLDATVNPDFAQVEVDPAVVNLSAFETFFQEKRPFFVEGADVFRFGGIRTHNSFNFPRFFFSRRIGRQPQGRVPVSSAGFADVPTETTIRGAAKLSGRTASGWSLGVLNAVTAEERTRYVDPPGAPEASAPVEPLTNSFVGRVRRELAQGNTTLGGLVTTAHRDLDDPALRAALRERGYLAGVDFTRAWRNRSWSFDGAVAWSRVDGSAGAIARTQRSSARYFQRPDQDRVRFDANADRLSGHAFQVSLSKNAGVHWLGSLTYQEVSPGFEVNDLGFETRADERALSTLVGYKEDRPRKVVRNWNVIPFTNHTWNFDGDLFFGSYGLLGDLTFANFWSLFLRGDLAPRSLDDRLTRGGPLAGQPASGDVMFSLESDSRRTTQGDLFVFYAWDAAGGWNTVYNLELSARPTPAVRLSIEPSLERRRSLAQYVSTVPDTSANATYDARYLFGTLEQTEVSLETRVEWTFTPRLSFQLFLQPLLSAGDFSDLKELAAPRSYRFNVYGRDVGTRTPVAGGDDIDPDGGGPATSFFVPEQDFNLRSLRANAVLRWEYRPGSTLFVVWQQGRQDAVALGDFRLRRDVDALFARRPDNTFAVKLSYWLGL